MQFQSAISVYSFRVYFRVLTAMLVCVCVCVCVCVGDTAEGPTSTTGVSGRLLRVATLIGHIRPSCWNVLCILYSHVGMYSVR